MDGNIPSQRKGINIIIQESEHLSQQLSERGYQHHYTRGGIPITATLRERGSTSLYKSRNTCHSNSQREGVNIIIQEEEHLSQQLSERGCQHHYSRGGTPITATLRERIVTPLFKRRNTYHSNSQREGIDIIIQEKGHLSQQLSKRGCQHHYSRGGTPITATLRERISTPLFKRRKTEHRSFYLIAMFHVKLRKLSCQTKIAIQRCEGYLNIHCDSSNQGD